MLFGKAKGIKMMIKREGGRKGKRKDGKERQRGQGKGKGRKRKEREKGKAKGIKRRIKREGGGKGKKGKERFFFLNLYQMWFLFQLTSTFLQLHLWNITWQKQEFFFSRPFFFLF